MCLSHTTRDNIGETIDSSSSGTVSCLLVGYHCSTIQPIPRTPSRGHQLMPTLQFLVYKLSIAPTDGQMNIHQLLPMCHWIAMDRSMEWTASAPSVITDESGTA